MADREDRGPGSRDQRGLPAGSTGGLAAEGGDSMDSVDGGIRRSDQSPPFTLPVFERFYHFCIFDYSKAEKLVHIPWGSGARRVACKSTNPVALARTYRVLQAVRSCWGLRIASGSRALFLRSSRSFNAIERGNCRLSTERSRAQLQLGLVHVPESQPQIQKMINQ